MDALTATETTTKKGPRAADSYRGARRNSWKAARRLPEWRQHAHEIANWKAELAERAVVANGAREAAAKAMVNEATQTAGVRRDVVIASAMLDYYCTCQRTRPVSRIIRGLEKQVRT